MNNPDDKDIVFIEPENTPKLSLPKIELDNLWDIALTGVISENSKRVYRAGMIQFARYLLMKSESLIPDDDEELLKKATPILSQVTFPFVAEYREWMREQDYSGSTINGRLAAINMLFKRMKRLNLIKENPADSDFVQRMKVPSVSNSEGLDKDESTLLLKVCIDDESEIRGNRDLALLSVMIFNGLRRSEVIQIDLDRIRMVDDTPTTKLRIKGGKSLTIEFIPEVWNVILKWIKIADIKKGPVFRKLNGNRAGGVCVSKKRLTDSGVYRIIKGRIKESGINKNIHPHSLRHTYATLALLGGVPIQDLQISMGHASTNTTFRYYRVIDQVGRSPGRKIDIQMPTGKGDNKQ